MFAKHVIIALLAAVVTSAIYPAVAQEALPIYDSAGNFKLPRGYQTWVFVGSNLGLAYKDELPDVTQRESARALTQTFHNIYIDPAAYAAFVKTGEFPDPTVLVMELYLAETKDSAGVLKEGVFNGPRQLVEAAVKDSKRPPHEESKENWAYYIFPLNAEGIPAESAPAAHDTDCFACHKRHASHDNVWVQFYPLLRDRTQP